MEILTVSVIGVPDSTSSNLFDSNVFQDYDAVVVDPKTLDNLYGWNRIEYHDRDSGFLGAHWARLLSETNEDRSEEVKGLLRRGGVVVVFLEPLISYRYQETHQGKTSWFHITNYDWLGNLAESEGIKSARGNTLELLDSNHPFAEYLNTKPPWSAYFDKEDCKKWKVLAGAFGTHALAITKRVDLGQIVLLPSYYHYSNGELLKRCVLRLLGDKDITPVPRWAEDILVPGQTQLVTEINATNHEVNALEQKRQTLVEANDKLKRWKFLLYGKGKHELEPVVREALLLLGCNVEPQADKDSDGLVSCDCGQALLEVVGSKETIKIEKLGELVKNLGNFLASKGTIVKGVLVGNPFCDEPMANRPPKDSQKKLFAKELLDSAEKQSITVLLANDLYELMCLVLNGRVSDREKKALRHKIFDGKGLVRLIEESASAVPA